MKTALITGVSTGIGRAAAEELLRRGWRVYGSVRKLADAPPGVLPLVFDVTDRAAMEAALQQIAHPLDALINNAGIAIAGPLLELPEADLRRQMEVNFFAPIALTKACLPHFAPAARILMVSSISGRAGSPFVGAYAASKHALEGASESLRRELMFLGHDVILLCPGAIQTPIWNKAELAPFAHGRWAAPLRKAEAYLERTASSGLPVSRMGRLIARILSTPRPRTRYTPVPSKLFRWTLPQLLPPRWLDRLIYRALR
jgi:NAD(P)-dependent dehydrogenase (short-subunit alcohol dehydrogenase family)